MIINDPVTLAEMEAAFARYEAALVSNDVDVLIIGAGACGLSAAIAAHDGGVSARLKRDDDGRLSGVGWRETARGDLRRLRVLPVVIRQEHGARLIE